MTKKDSIDSFTKCSCREVLLMNPAMNANFIGLIVVAIVALASYFILIWKIVAISF